MGFPGESRYLDRIRRPDALHTYTIHVLDGSSSPDMDGFRAGNLLISMRNIDTLAIVDPAEGKVVWALAESWKEQHEPVLLEDGGILLFDRLGGARGSRIVEIDPRSGAVRWVYEGVEPGAFSSRVCGSNERLANGNTPITESTAGRAFEETKGREIVWDFRSRRRIQEESGEMVAILGEVTRIDPDFVASRLRRPLRRERLVRLHRGPDPAYSQPSRVRANQRYQAPPMKDIDGAWEPGAPGATRTCDLQVRNQREHADSSARTHEEFLPGRLEPGAGPETAPLSHEDPEDGP